MAILFAAPRFKATDLSNAPISGAFLQFYQFQTSTPQPIYSDSTLQTVLTNPVQADDNGLFPEIWLDDSLPPYKVVFSSPDSVNPTVPGSTIWTIQQYNYIQDPAQLAKSIAEALYPVSLAESQSGLAETDLNLLFPYGDLRRFKCDPTGATDNTTQIQNAIKAALTSGGTGYIYHPGGTIAHNSQIAIPNNLAILGFHKAACTFKYTGSQSAAWKYTGVAPWSGYANVIIRNVCFNYINAVTFAAAVEINAWGWSYWDIDNVWIKGACSYGIILDGVEIGSVHNSIIENINPTSNYNIWIVNGADRGFTQGTGFSNIITLRENQLSSNSTVAIGLVDDGGNGRIVQGNNFNGHRIPAVFAGVTGLKTGGNSYETTQQTGSANVQFNSVTQAGNTVGPCSGGEISGDGFYGNMSSGSCLVFGGQLNTVTNVTKASTAVVTVSTVSAKNPFAVGAPLSLSGVTGMTQINGVTGRITAVSGSSGAWTATTTIDSSGFSNYTSGGQAQMMHSGFLVAANNFGDLLGRGGAIDVTFLANSWCMANTDFGVHSGDAHYVGAHNDANGNVLMPPANGFGGAITSAPSVPAPVFGDSRSGYVFASGVGVNGSTPPSQLTGWGTPTGTVSPVSNLAGGTATLAQVSQAVAQIIAYLKSKGDFAA
jgi:hypothetical protein